MIALAQAEGAALNHGILCSTTSAGFGSASSRMNTADSAESAARKGNTILTPHESER